ncbi:MAG: GNAT family N-acetyltransferase [Deltaproteobacteria bacterium]|nr:GNAT family N-acetyltransferase [Deltaproteobacteria bacterium]
MSHATEFVVRPARVADREIVCAIRAHVGWDQELVESWFHDVARGSRFMWLAQVGAEVAGMVALDLVDRHDPDVADGHSRAAVTSLAVLPPFLRRGLGRFLTQHVEKEARSRGVTWITLFTDPANSAAIRLYESLGYVEYKKHQRPWGMAVHMHKRL